MYRVTLCVLLVGLGALASAKTALPGTHPGKLYTSPGGEIICVCPRVDDDCKCVIGPVLPDGVGEDEDFYYFPATISFDGLSATPIYTAYPEGEDVLGFDRDLCTD